MSYMIYKHIIYLIDLECFFIHYLLTLIITLRKMHFVLDCAVLAKQQLEEQSHKEMTSQ